MNNSIKRIWNSRTKKVLAALVVLGVFVYVVLAVRGVISPPIYLRFGSVALRLYSFAILLAIGVAAFTFRYIHRDDKKLVSLDIWNALLYMLIPGVIGARIYHVLTDYYLYQSDPIMILALWNGGLGIIGGLVGGAIGLAYFAHKYGISKMYLLSRVVMVIPLAQAVGRLGNLFNRELYGMPTDLPWGLYVEPQFRFYQLRYFEYYHPLFLYEAVWNILIFAAMYLYWRKNKKQSGFRLIGIYLLGYGMIRFLLDFLRIDGRNGVLGLTYAQWLIFILLTSAVLFGSYYQLWHKWKYGKWFTKKK